MKFRPVAFANYRDQSIGFFGCAIRVVEGDVTHRAAVEAASAGQDAAIVALGASNPFRRMPSLTVVMHNILMALEAAVVPRLIYLSADSVDRRRLNFLRRRVIVPLLLAATAAEVSVPKTSTAIPYCAAVTPTRSYPAAWTSRHRPRG